MPLNPKQLAFVREYLIDHNATQAAIRAGYSAKTAYAQGCRLLKHAEVARAIAAGEARINEKAGLTAELVRRTYYEALTFDPRFTVDEKGNALELTQMAPAVRRALSGFERKPFFCEGAQCGEVIVARHPDKLAAAAAAARLLGLDKGGGDDEKRPISIRIQMGAKDKGDG